MPQLKINSHSPFSRSLPSLQRPQLRKKPRLGSSRNFPTCFRRTSPAKSKHASEMRTCLYDFCRRTRVTTYDRDKESGLDYAMARMYANIGGRFTSPDQGSISVKIPGSLNRYAYSASDPINLGDPTGNFSVRLTFVAGGLEGCYGLGGLPFIGGIYAFAWPVSSDDIDCVFPESYDPNCSITAQGNFYGFASLGQPGCEQQDQSDYTSVGRTPYVPPRPDCKGHWKANGSLAHQSEFPIGESHRSTDLFGAPEQC